MNYVLQFLDTNRQRLDLAAYGIGDRLTSVILTPRFRASSHVVVLVLTEGKPEPVLVAKVARLQDGNASLQREATSLRLVQKLRPSGFDSIPRVVAFEEFNGRPVLVETALVGRPMDPPQIRRRFRTCCQAAINWLSDVHRLRENGNENTSGWFERLVAGQLDYLAEVIPWSREDQRRLERTRDMVEPLRGTELPSVLEHGDFSHPNVMLLKDGRAGVVDWEMADPHGLPCHDLIFFLTYAAFARENARENDRYVPAIQAAFFGKAAWARRYLLDYAEQLQLPFESLTPLFLLCWVRYMVGLLRRLNESGEPFSNETANWLRQNRYYTAWCYALEHIDQLHLSGERQ